MLKLLVATLLLPATGGAIAPGRQPGAQSVSGSAPAELAAKVHAGQDLFQHTCMQCHAVLEGQYSFGPNLYGEMKKPHPKKTTPEVKELLKNGKGKMPAFGDKLAPSDMENLIAYLHTL